MSLHSEYSEYLGGRILRLEVAGGGGLEEERRDIDGSERV